MTLVEVADVGKAFAARGGALFGGVERRVAGDHVSPPVEGGGAPGVGGESGPVARPMHPAWVRSIRDQCAAAGTAFFFKQWGKWAAIDQSREADDAGWQGRGNWMILDRNGDLDIPDHRWPDEEDGEVAVIDVGKSRAGRLLDGIEHNAMPRIIS